MSDVDALAAALLYEGYVLYPYRASSLKNRQRFSFGGLHPRAWSERQPSDRWWAAAEVLLEGDSASVDVELCFLELVLCDAWHEAIERRVAIEGRGSIATPGVPGRLSVTVASVAPGVQRVRAHVENAVAGDWADRDRALTQTLASAHLIIRARRGALISLLEPPEALRPLADACKNEGLWPVLVGERGERHTMLASPIILYDYPAIAPESPSDMFDGTEIDEILALRVLTLTDAEKHEVRRTDRRARELLARVERLGPEAFRRLHGSVRGRRPLADVARTWELAGSGAEGDPDRPPASVGVGGRAVVPGDRVRLCPVGGADGFDLVLAGRIATVASIEQDLEDRVYLAVTIDDDPGADLGTTGTPAHRFFFRPEEVEPL